MEVPVRQYGFFSYAASEALCLSEKEKEMIIGIYKHIEHELSLSIDNFSQDIILSQIEQLLNYSNRLIDKAKEILSTADLTVGEIACQLGFEHPQSFNILFKNKTKVSPVEFRQSFN